MIPVNPLTVAWAALASSAEKIPDAEDVRPGWLLFVVVAGLTVAVVFLLLSFRKQLRKVDSSLPSAKGGDGRAGDDVEQGNGAGGSPRP